MRGAEKHERTGESATTVTWLLNVARILRQEISLGSIFLFPIGSLYVRAGEGGYVVTDSYQLMTA